MEQNQNNLFRSIFYFDTMLMPKIIMFVYWMILLVIFLGAVGAILDDEVGEGLGIMFFGSVGARLLCELMIVLFKINENIQKIADRS